MEKTHYNSQYEKMTQMPVSRLIATLGLPSTISMLITNIYNMADTYFVGKLGTSASGAVGIVFGIMAIIQAFGFMYGQGSGSIISRRLGAKDVEDADNTASVALFSSFATGLILSVFGLIFITPVVYFMGSTPTIFPYAKAYATCIFVAAPFIMSSFTMNNILRYQGKANLGLVGIGIGAIVNIILDPILMFTFKLGITGAGVATAFSQILGCTILFILFQSKRSQCTFSFKKIRCLPGKIGSISFTGLPALIRQGLGSVSTMMLNQSARVYGDPAVAAMSIVGRISFFIFAVGLGIGQGFQPVAGYNYGARKFQRVRKGFIFTLVMGEVLLGAFAIVGMLLSGHLVGIFRDDPEVIRIGSPALLYQCIAVLTMPLTVCTNMLYQSVGKSFEASLLSVMRSGLYFIPMILILPAQLGLLGVQIAQPVADGLTFLCSIPFMLKFLRELSESSTE